MTPPIPSDAEALLPCVPYAASPAGEVTEAISRAIDPDAWRDDLANPTRAAIEDMHRRRQAANSTSLRVVAALATLSRAQPSDVERPMEAMSAAFAQARKDNATLREALAQPSNSASVVFSPAEAEFWRVLNQMDQLPNSEDPDVGFAPISRWRTEVWNAVLGVKSEAYRAALLQPSNAGSAEAVREAAAKVCDTREAHYRDRTDRTFSDAAEHDFNLRALEAACCAAAIRALALPPSAEPAGWWDAERLRAELRSVTDMLATLLEVGKFPDKGRSRDDKNDTQSWWEDHVQAVRSAYAALAGVSHDEWQGAHPGLHIPAPGPVTLPTPPAAEAAR